MTFGTSDLASVLVAPDQEFSGFAQGVLTSWDSDTFENTVRVRGSDLHDLPVASGVEALTYQAGDVVMLTRWRPSGGGTASYWIGMNGRVVHPGAGRAEETIAFMQTSLSRQIVETIVQDVLDSPLGSELTAAIFADRVHSDTIETTESTTSTTFTDLATVGPTVADVDITESGKALVFLSSEMTSGSSPNMSVEVSGATSIAASDERILAFGTIDQFGGTMTRMIPFTGLNAGTHQFQAKYRDPNGEESFWAYRNLAVIAL